MDYVKFGVVIIGIMVATILVMSGVLFLLYLRCKPHLEVFKGMIKDLKDLLAVKSQIEEAKKVKQDLDNRLEEAKNYTVDILHKKVDAQIDKEINELCSAPDKAEPAMFNECKDVPDEILEQIRNNKRAESINKSTIEQIVDDDLKAKFKNTISVYKQEGDETIDNWLEEKQKSIELEKPKMMRTDEVNENKVNLKELPQKVVYNTEIDRKTANILNESKIDEKEFGMFKNEARESKLSDSFLSDEEIGIIESDSLNKEISIEDNIAMAEAKSNISEPVIEPEPDTVILDDNKTGIESLTKDTFLSLNKEEQADYITKYVESNYDEKTRPLVLTEILSNIKTNIKRLKAEGIERENDTGTVRVVKDFSTGRHFLGLETTLDRVLQNRELQNNLEVCH